MSRGQVQAETHRFFCTSCGNEGVPLQRQRGKRRGVLHTKTLYCIHCQRETKHIEITPGTLYTVEDFQKDLSIGKFKNI